MLWRIDVPAEGIGIDVEATFPEQELTLFPVTYWEGSVRVDGSHQGEGYMELTGYAGEVPLH